MRKRARLWMFIPFYFYPIPFSLTLHNSYDSIPKCSKKPLLNTALTLLSLPRLCYALLFSYPIIIFYVCVNWSIGTSLKFVYSTINQPSATSTPLGSWHFIWLLFKSTALRFMRWQRVTENKVACGCSLKIIMEMNVWKGWSYAEHKFSRCMCNRKIIGHIAKSGSEALGENNCNNLWFS